MGFFDFLRGVKRPDEGIAAVSRADLEQRLLALNSEQVPFSVTRGDESDIQAEWKIVDAQWYEIFAKAGLEKSHRIYLGLNEDKHEVKALEEAWEVEWRAGVPTLRLSMEKQQGRTLFSKSAGTAGKTRASPAPMPPRTS